MTNAVPALGVLLIEDNPGDAELARLALANAAIGVEVRVTDRLQSALAYIAAAAPDVVLLDLGLPDVNGLEGVDMIARHAPQTPIHCAERTRQ